MTDEERKDEIDRYNRLLKDTLMQVLSEDGKKGIVAFRMFYSVAHGDDTFSVANIGGTGENNEHAAIMLLQSISALMLDVQDNREHEYREVPKKS